jgi:hypothetical protein
MHTPWSTEMKKMRGNELLILGGGLRVRIVNDDGTKTWVVLEEDVRVCCNSNPAYRTLEDVVASEQ